MPNALRSIVYVLTFNSQPVTFTPLAQFIPLNLFGFYLTGMEFIFLFIPSGLNFYPV